MLKTATTTMPDAQEELPSREGSLVNEQSNSPPSLFQSLSVWVRSSLIQRSEGSLKEAIEEILDERDDVGSDMLSDEERLLFKNILTFGELSVGDIHIPRSDIVAIEENISLSDLRDLATKEQHTRLPVYQESLDHITGFVHLKDLLPFLGADNGFSARTIRRELLFVPPSMRVVDLLVKMRMSGCHMAIVIDEYGGTDGLVTMEDLFEELVGEIQDEHDEDEEILLSWIDANTLEVDARISIEDIEEELNIDLTPNNEEEEIDTLAGLIFAELGRVPARGEVFNLAAHISCEIISADPRRIRKVRLVRVQKSA